MSNERKVNFSTSVRNSRTYDSNVIKLLIGFVPTEDECESLTFDQLKDTELASREKECAADVVYFLDKIESDYPGIEFNEPVLTYLGVEYFDKNEFFGVFEFEVSGTYTANDENLSDIEIRKMVDDLVFENCEIHLH